MEKKLKVLVACEFSQVVTSSFLELGHDAYSCDLLPCRGPYPDRHICSDVRELFSDHWDIVIAHPPCTYLTKAAENRFNFLKDYNSAKSRWLNRIAAVDLFVDLYNFPGCNHVCVENPVGFMNLPSVFRSPDQIIQPYQFGDPVSKRTCLWFRGLPSLTPSYYVKPEFVYSNGRKYSRLMHDTFSLPPSLRSSVRSTFFPGVAACMASQFSDYVLYSDYGFPRSFPGCQMEFDFS